MDCAILFVFIRKGCCLCEGLEQRLRCLDLQKISPLLDLKVIDIDDENTPKNIRKRFDLEVPVLGIGRSLYEDLVTLPRVSPRLKGEALLNWLQKACRNSFFFD